jgi:atypical dual specificity phosphatase
MTEAIGFRPLPMPAGIPGRLYLGAMPGCHAPLELVAAALAAEGIGHILCLASAAEIATASPAYAAALEARELPVRFHAHPVPDYAAPRDAAAFIIWLDEAAALLRGEERLLLHCAAGIGRTGTAALCLLHRLGSPPEQARALVAAAGSWPETAAQRDFVARVTGG